MHDSFALSAQLADLSMVGFFSLCYTMTSTEHWVQESLFHPLARNVKQQLSAADSHCTSKHHPVAGGVSEYFPIRSEGYGVSLGRKTLPIHRMGMQDKILDRHCKDRIVSLRQRRVEPVCTRAH